MVADPTIKDGGVRLLVKMLIDNPNIGYYEHLGASKLGSLPFVWEGHQTKEIVYGWGDVKSLISTA